ncbi:helix-turn-helix domain-containing protein [Sphaerisporangium rufum]|uniref:helix-turn-helix domain-containing protein n=1 Tax=Sphaerisporangium rufum TaxID=1381558 RepID=UPI0019520078|nr:helix-turn-helix domain-containing protein [Sphaerisporangium rufum]
MVFRFPGQLAWPFAGLDAFLKTGKGRAIRFSTLARLCQVLGCQPGDLLGYAPARTGAGPP